MRWPALSPGCWEPASGDVAAWTEERAGRGASWLHDAGGTPQDGAEKREAARPRRRHAWRSVWFRRACFGWLWTGTLDCEWVSTRPRTSRASGRGKNKPRPLLPLTEHRRGTVRASTSPPYHRICSAISQRRRRRRFWHHSKPVSCSVPSLRLPLLGKTVEGLEDHPDRLQAHRITR